jgi:hypothetical protein
MHIKLPSGYVDPRTHAPLPDAVLVIFDTEFRMRAQDTRVIAQIYASAAAIGTAMPITEYLIALGPDERDAQMPALLAALYQVVLARPEYTGASFVADG